MQVLSFLFNFAINRVIEKRPVINGHKGGLRKPEWLKIKLHNTSEFSFVSGIVEQYGLHTICSSGRCPNKSECWNRGTATFMILGDICTRSCKFCATRTGRPLAVDGSEPDKLARSVSLMQLRHCVLTSVDRDDLPDGGAHHWASVIEAVRAENPDTTIEVLLPDFGGDSSLLDIVADSGPDIAGHNIETVCRMTPQVRSRARYDVSLQVLSHLSRRGLRVKSGLMVGLGETDEEVVATLQDLRDHGCSIVTIGQYLQPTERHWPVSRYVHPDVFAGYREAAESMGFEYVESAPLVRSSYMAERALCKVKRSLRSLSQGTLKPVQEE